MFLSFLVITTKTPTKGRSLPALFLYFLIGIHDFFVFISTWIYFTGAGAAVTTENRREVEILNRLCDNSTFTLTQQRRKSGLTRFPRCYNTYTFVKWKWFVKPGQSGSMWVLVLQLNEFSSHTAMQLVSLSPVSEKKEKMLHIFSLEVVAVGVVASKTYKYSPYQVHPREGKNCMFFYTFTAFVLILCNMVYCLVAQKEEQ